MPFYKGQKFTDETRQKMSLSKLGNKNPLFGKTPSVETIEKRVSKTKGKKRTVEFRSELSNARKGDGNPMFGKTGNKCYNWKGGITPENKRIRGSIEFRLWREAVFARDNWTCQICDKRGSTMLHAHHIKGFAEYPDLRFVIDNGQTLCPICHKTTDNYQKHIK